MRTATAVPARAQAVGVAPRGAHPTGSPAPVGGRLARYAPKWEMINPGPWVLRTVAGGYHIEFTADPPFHCLPRDTPVPPDMERRIALEAEIESLLQKEAIERTPPDATPKFMSTFFLTTKKDGSWRPIINLKPFNKRFVRPKRFRMETLSDIKPALRNGMWATSIDLKDAYLHIPVAPECRDFLTFQYRGDVFRFKALPFGLSTSPRVFTRVTRPILAYLRVRGIKIFAYLDDWLVLAESRETAEAHTTMATDLLTELGWIINIEKSSLQPTQSIQYLGASIDFVGGMIYPTEERVSALTRDATALLRKGSGSARTWLRVLGRMASFVDILQRGRLHMRPLQTQLLRRYKPATGRMNTVVPLPQHLKHFLRWWTLQRNVATGVPFNDDRPRRTLTTDASLTGWGATLDDLEMSGLWSSRETGLHINVLEARAILNAVSRWKHLLRNHAVTVRSDNTTSVAYINKEGGTRSRLLNETIWNLLTLCDRNNIALEATHLAGSDNRVADALSRSPNPGEWTLKQEWANYLFSIYDTPSLDLFATAENRRLPLFCSRFYHPEAWRTDAYSFKWDGLYLYAFPPLSQIRKVLSTLQTSNAEMLLVVPFWPNQPWFPLLLELLVEEPLKFPETAQLLDKTGPRRRHTQTHQLHLSAWRISGETSRRKDFLRRLSTLPQPRGDHQLLTRTMPDWLDSGDGQATTIVIPWKLP